MYGGNTWLRYDEQFPQQKAVRPSIRWDHKDISLWMRLMSAPHGSGQPIRGSTDGSEPAGGRSASTSKGCCWQFNKGQCKFRQECRYRHECSGCGGSHGLSRCFKRGKGRVEEADPKRGDRGESGKDAPLSKGVPQERQLPFWNLISEMVLSDLVVRYRRSIVLAIWRRFLSARRLWWKRLRRKYFWVAWWGRFDRSPSRICASPQ